MNIKNNQKGFIVQGIVAVVALVVIVGVAIYFGTKDKITNTEVVHSELISKYPALKDDSYLEAKFIDTVFETDITFCDAQTVINYSRKNFEIPRSATSGWRDVYVFDCESTYYVGVNDESASRLYGPFGQKQASTLKTYENIEYGFSFNYPQNYELLNRTNGFLAMFQDKSKVFPNPDVANLIMVEARPAKGETSFENFIKKYPVLNANNNKPYVFTSRVLGGKTFYYTLTERFEGTLSFMYCILNNDTVLCLHSVSNGVDWTNQNLDEEADSTHTALRSILATLKFTSPTNTVQSKGTVSTTPSIKVLSPNGGETLKIGQTSKISFSSVGDLGTKTIRLHSYSDDGIRLNSYYIGTTQSASEATITIPNNVEASRFGPNYKIQILVDKYNTGKGVADESDRNFSIIK